MMSKQSASAEFAVVTDYLKDKLALNVTSNDNKNRHAKGSWYQVWKGIYEIMENQRGIWLPLLN